MRTIRLTALAVGATLALAGCAGGGSDAEDSAEAGFTLYSGRDEELVGPLIEMFEEETGISVDVRYGNTAELGALLLEEGERSPAQVFLSQDAGALGALSREGLFATLPEEVTAAVPAGFTSADDTWVGVTGRARVIVYDGEELTAEQVPSTVDAFTEPEWRGRFGIAPTNASFQAFVTAYRVLEGEAAAEAWVEAIAANDPQIFESNVPILAAVNEGVIDAGLINHYYWFRQAAETGAENMRAQLAFAEPGDPGSIVNVTGAGILQTAADDPEALEFVRFLVSEQAQQYFVESTYEYPLVEGIDAPDGLPELGSLVNPDLDLADLDSLAQTQDLLAEHGLL